MRAALAAALRCPSASICRCRRQCLSDADCNGHDEQSHGYIREQYGHVDGFGHVQRSSVFIVAASPSRPDLRPALPHPR